MFLRRSGTLCCCHSRFRISSTSPLVLDILPFISRRPPFPYQSRLSKREVPEFEEAAFKAELNHVVRCKTQFGWHLLQALSEREPVRDIQVKELQDPVFMEEAQLNDVREPDEIAKASFRCSHSANLEPGR